MQKNMSDPDREQIIRELFERLDRDSSNTISIAELDSILQQVTEEMDLSLLADRIRMHFDLASQELTFEDFRTWMLNEFNVASARGFNANLHECLKIPAVEVILALEDIKTRVSEKDRERLEWCISQIMPNTFEKYEPQILPMRSFLARETVSQIEEHSNLRFLRLAINDEEMSRKSMSKRMTLSSPSSSIDLDIYLPQSTFDISSFDLDIFQLAEEYGRITLLNMYAFKAFSHWDLFLTMGIDVQTFLRYCTYIGEGYKPNPYHNVLHAADVLNASHVILHASKLYAMSEMTPIHAFSLLMAAIVHDYKHPGLNNAYLMMTGHKLAIRYNDSAILENYHVAKAFQIAQRENMNIFSNISKEEYRTIRKLMISAVLSTDMTKHSRHVSEVQTKLFKGSNLKNEKEFVLNTILHLSDICNPCRIEKISEAWAQKVSEEFFMQGDKERESGGEVSALCDRNTLNIAKGQIGFISGVVLPMLSPITSALEGLEFMQHNATSNRDKWAERIQEFEEKLEKAI
jgi:hypothetical protein